MMSFVEERVKLPEARASLASLKQKSGAKGLLPDDAEAPANKNLGGRPTVQRSNNRRTNID